MHPIPSTVDELIEFLAEDIRARRVLVFCGAGVSVRSGLPDARELVNRILVHLPLSNEDRQVLLASRLPFEAFMDTLNTSTSIDCLLDLFKLGVSNSNHLLVAKLARLDLIRLICTTNFDLLFEKALKLEGLHTPADFQVFYQADHFPHVKWQANTVNVLKIHGSIEEKASIIGMLRQVAVRQSDDCQSALIKTIFATGPHETVLVLGYSFSDVFDISPQIEMAGQEYKRIVIVHHVPEVPPHVLQPPSLENLANSCEDSPLRQARWGLRVRINTDAFIQRLWSALLRDDYHLVQTSTTWEKHVAEWAEQFSTLAPGTAPRVVGRLFEALSQFTLASEYYKNSYRVAKSSGARPMEGRLLNDLGRVANSQSQYRRAIRYHRRAYAIAQELGSLKGQAKSSGNLGTAFHNLGQYNEAIKLQQNVIRLARKLAQPRIERIALGQLGLSLRSMGRFESAAKCHRRSVRIARTIGDKAGEARQLANLGLCFRRMGQYEEAKQCHQLALSILRQLDNRRGQGIEEGNLGLVYAALGDYASAFRAYRRSMKIARNVGSSVDQIRQLGNLADIYVSTGRFRRAVLLAERALQLAIRIGQRYEQAVQLGTIAKAYLGIGDFSVALTHARESLDLFTQLFGEGHHEGNEVLRILRMAEANIGWTSPE